MVRQRSPYQIATPDEENQNLISYPEIRGEVFSGKISSKNETDILENKKIALSIPGENFDFKITSTDKNGNFHFLMDNFNGEEAYFQVKQKNKENYKIQLLENQKVKANVLERDVKINPNYAKAFLKRSNVSTL